MSDQVENLPKTQDAGAALPTTRTPEYKLTESVNPVMDTAGFEHLVRVSRIIAESGMMHKTLVMDGEKYLPANVIMARAFIIAELASRIKQSPISVMQCASFVHGRLMLEGKFVNAMLTETYGIQLTFDFGLWDAKTETVDLAQEGVADMLGIRVTGIVNGREEIVEGCVGGWKTTKSGSPWQPGTFKRQLRYRGTREWARAYRPSAILGIVTDDEPIESNDIAPIERPSLSSKLAAPKPEGRAASTGKPEGGFDTKHIDDTIGTKDISKPAAEAKADNVVEPEPKTIEATPDTPGDADDVPHDPETGEVIENKPDAPAATAAKDRSEMSYTELKIAQAGDCKSPHELEAMIKDMIRDERFKTLESLDSHLEIFEAIRELPFFPKIEDGSLIKSRVIGGY